MVYVTFDTSLHKFEWVGSAVYVLLSTYTKKTPAYPKRERYCFNRLCFEMAQLFTLSIEPDIGKIILKVISDQIKIIFSKNDFKSDQDHI
jgi:hypothetical protein